MTPPHAGTPSPHVLTRLAPLLLAALLGACATAPGPQPGADTSVATAPAAVQAAPAAAATPAPSAPLALVVPQPDANAPTTIAVDPLRPTELLDLGAPGTQTDLWARVRQGTAIPDLQNERVEKWQQWYASRPDYVQRMTERGGRYLFHIIEEVNKRGLPAELALLPFIESAFNPQAMSSAKASGMWQFIPGTGRDFSLRQNVFRDDRRDVLASTRAALDYLQMLHGMFGDWQLALAAYNWGQGNVQRAIARNEKAGLPTDYDSLRMPDETRNYLPKLQAVENIVANPQAFGLALPVLQNHPYFVSVGIDRDIDLELAARLAGLPADEFKQLNPQMNKPVILAAGTPQVLLPYDNANRFVRALGQHRGNLASWTAWVVPRTLKPADAARQVGMDEGQLRSINNIPKGMLVKAGSTLLVPRGAHRTDDVAEHIADHATLALAPDLPPLRRISFKAGKKGESVVAVARRYGVRADQVAQWNGTSAAAHFKPGQAVVVMVPNRPARVAAARAGERTPAKAGPAKRLSKPSATARSRGRAD
jgi:membrane-bound lytic murein transglycosylase D